MRTITSLPKHNDTRFIQTKHNLAEIAKVIGQHKSDGGREFKFNYCSSVCHLGYGPNENTKEQTVCLFAGNANDASVHSLPGMPESYPTA